MAPALLLVDEQAHPLALLRLLVGKYGKEFLSAPWSMSVVRKSVEADFEVELPEINLHKILAAVAVATQDSFWEHWEHFHFLVQVLSNNVPDPATHHELSVAQMMVAVDIASTIRAELATLSHQPAFSEELGRYVAAQALQAGVWYLPPPLAFAEHHAAGKSYKCRDCGNVSEIVFDDGFCDICTDRFNLSSMAGWTPDLKLVGKGWGKNIEIFEKNPTRGVRERFAAALQKRITLQENRDDICAAKLLVAVHFVEKRRNQLKVQA